MSVCGSLFLLIVPVCGTLVSQNSLAWILGDKGGSCTDACSKIGQQCTSRMLHQHNSEVNSEREMEALISSFNGKCTRYNLNYGSNTDVPAYKATNEECYVSDISRDEKAFNCDRLASPDKQRLCGCHHAISEDDTQDANDNSSQISSGVMIWIVSGNMLFIGLVGMCCGVVRRLVDKSRGKDEVAEMSRRPEDPGIFVRCPDCGCPLERSSAPSTFVTYTKTTPNREISKRSVSRSETVVEADEEADNSGPVVKISDKVSEVSVPVNSMAEVYTKTNPHREMSKRSVSRSETVFEADEESDNSSQVVKISDKVSEVSVAVNSMAEV